MDYREAYWEHLERTKEIMAGDPDYDETQARMLAHKHAGKFSGGDGMTPSLKFKH